MEHYFQDGRRVEVSETHDRLTEIEAERSAMRRENGISGYDTNELRHDV
jgi:hypothetical protein